MGSAMLECSFPGYLIHEEHTINLFAQQVVGVMSETHKMPSVKCKEYATDQAQLTDMGCLQRSA